MKLVAVEWKVSVPFSVWMASVPAEAFPRFAGSREVGEIQRAHAFHGEARGVAAVDGIGDVKAVQGVARLVFRATLKVEAAGGVLDDARHQFHGIAQAVAGGIGNVVDFGSAQALFALCLGRVDRRGRCAHGDALKYLLLRVERDGCFRGGACQLQRAVAHLEVARAVDVEPAIDGRRERELEGARWSE